MASFFFAFLAMLSWFPVSFVIPATSLAYVAGAFGAKLFLGEHLNGDALGGNFPDLPGRGHGVGRRSSGVFDISFRVRGTAVDNSCAGIGPAVLLPRRNLFRVEIFSRGASRGRATRAFARQATACDQHFEAAART